jgi:hypothetical protein
MSLNEESEQELAEFTGNIGRLLKHAANEDILIAKIKKYFSPPEVELFQSDEEVDELQSRIINVFKNFGGPPMLIIHKENDEPPIYDTYGETAFDEIFSTFLRTRKVVYRAQLFLIACGYIKIIPDVLLSESDGRAVSEEDVLKVKTLLTNRIFEELEVGYVRLVSFWDRIGQLLDYIFFNIRQYERDGFAAVMDRISKNYAPRYLTINNSNVWKRLREYQTSESKQGFKWLIHRRNLLTHSIHLREINENSKEDSLFLSAYDHLKESSIKKLQAGTIEEEFNNIHKHLSVIPELLLDVVSLCEIGAKIQSERCAN